MKKIFTILLSALFVCNLFACDNNQNESSNISGGLENSSSGLVEEKPDPKPVETYGWNTEPVVSNIFYDDFGNGFGIAMYFAGSSQDDAYHH